jgi:hypothetical protein
MLILMKISETRCRLFLTREFEYRVSFAQQIHIFKQISKKYRRSAPIFIVDGLYFDVYC